MSNPTTPDKVATNTSKGDSEVERAFAAALRAAESAPDSAEAWEHLEERAEELRRADDVAALYRSLLERKLESRVFAGVAERAVQFHEEWFGDTPDKITALLERIIELDATADWAFEKLTVMLTSASQFDALLTLYDRTLAHARDAKQQRRLLNDAAQAAKDFANQPDRAADYMQRLLVLEPNNSPLFTSLERLLEKGERHRDLVALWESRIDHLNADEVRATRLRIASCWLEQLNDQQRALDGLRALLADSPGQPDACKLTERILADEQAELSTRRQALSLLRKNYLVAERPDDVIAVLEHALEFIEPDERRPLHREAATRLAIVGRDVEAISHYRALLMSDGADADARKQLRQLAKRSGHHDLQVAALVDAADAAEEASQQVVLLLEAADLRRSVLNDDGGAVALYTRVLDSPEAEPTAALTAAHRLNELLAEAGRDEERLRVLESLAPLEQSSVLRRFVLGEAARLADSLGHVDRALANWQPVLEAAPQDLEALSAVIYLLERAERWGELVDALHRRASATGMPLQRRADLLQIADVQLERLHAPADAIDSWLSVREQFGAAPEVLAALDTLMTDANRFSELAEVLAHAGQTEHTKVSALSSRLGDLYRIELERPTEARRCYDNALAITPSDERAAVGMRALLDDPQCRTEAAAALALAFGRTDDWQGVLALLEARRACTSDGRAEAQLLREAAALQLERGQDEPAALSSFCQALVLEPDNLRTEAQMLDLAERTSAWAQAAEALRAAAMAAGEDTPRGAELHKAEAAIHEARLDQPADALAAYQAAAESQIGDANAYEAMVRCAARANRWPDAADAAVRAIALRDRLPRLVIQSLTASPRSPEDWSALASSLEQALAQRPLRAGLARQVEVLIANWYRQQCDALPPAILAAQRAVEHDPRELEPLRLLADLQRAGDDPGLIDTLLKLDRILEQSLDPLYEAAELATASQHEVAQARAILERLYRKAAAMWIRSDSSQGEHRAPAVAQWALDQLIEHHILNNDPERAVHVLMDGTRLPLDTEKLCELRRRAGEMLAERGSRARAIDVYRGVLEVRPDDMDALQRTAELCEQEGRVSEALSLRLRELELIEDVDRRLELRLAHSRLTGALEAQGGRVASLRANLDDAPGHAASLDELTRVLEERGRHDELVAMLEEQAGRLQELDESAPAAQLWSRAAALAERSLGDIERAITAHRRVVDLDQSLESLDALARLHLGRGEPALAATWLEQRLATTEPAGRVAVLLKLAHARIAADEHDRAIEALRTAFEEAPRNAEVRKLLTGAYRSGKDWPALARTLTTAALAVGDERAVLSYAREAADIYHHRLEAPEQSVAVLQRAVEIASDDRDLACLLAEALRAAGDLDQAQTILEGLITDFGRRRSAERANVHLQLARVSRAQGLTDKALDQLETASKMDAGNTIILAALAEMAREADQLDRAERAYRTLLVTVRRAHDDDSLPIGPTEVLFELSRIAADRGEEDQAEELVVSVLESLAQHDDEAASISAKLGVREEYPLLERLLRARLEHVHSPHRRAETYAELAELLDRHLERRDEALESRLEAVRTDPGSPLHHQAARDLADTLDKLDSYVSTVETLLSDERADTSAHVRCELLLRLGEVLENERGDLERGAALYGQAEATGVRKVDVWRAQARVAGAAGDSEEQMRLLGLLASLGEDQSETRADALYRIAEVQLASAETLESGITSLGTALDDSFRAERAAMILERTSEAHPAHCGLLDIYETVARRSADDQTLLHYLDRRAHHADATPEQAHEAVDKALAMDRGEQAEGLMLRAAEIGRALNRADDLKRIDWALLGLAERRMDAGDLAGAVKWLSEAAEVGDLSEVLALARRVADLAAQPNGDLTLAAKLYEHLLERAPTAREAWQPLADIYARLGDIHRLEQMVAETLDGLQDPADRNALRVSLGKALLHDEQRAADAVDLLGEVLLKDPQQADARQLLADYLERSGRLDELVDMLRQQLEAAEGRSDGQAAKAAALGLASRLTGDDAEEARAILLRALEQLPDDPELLLALLQRLDAETAGDERLAVMRKLVQVEPVESAGSRALELLAEYEAAGNEDGALEALQLGMARAPDNEEIRGLLLQRYRNRGDAHGLAQCLADAAGRSDDAGDKAALLREAAGIYRRDLTDPLTASQLLGQAYELWPQDGALCAELALTLSEAGDHQRAIATLDGPIQVAEDEAVKLELLRGRASLYTRAGDLDSAMVDLDAACQIDEVAVAAELEETLSTQIERAAARGDEQAERAYTLRCVEVLLTEAKRDAASALLRSWTDRAADDIEGLRRLRDIDTADERWEAVAATCRRLVGVEEGAAQIDAALALAHAHHTLGDPEGAREGLEHARGAQPDSAEIRAELRKIYALTGDKAQIASLLLDDAQGTDDPGEQAELRHRAGELYVELEDAAAAVPPLRDALEQLPGDPNITATLTDAYILAGWFDDADELLDTAIGAAKGRRTAEVAACYQRKAQIAAAIGNAARQLEMLMEAHVCNKKNGAVAAKLADLAEELEQWQLAAKTLRTITLLDSDCPISRAEAFLRQGRIAHRQGDDKTAKMWARRANREDPDSEQATALLTELGERIPPRR